MKTITKKKNLKTKNEVKIEWMITNQPPDETNFDREEQKKGFLFSCEWQPNASQTNRGAKKLYDYAPIQLSSTALEQQELEIQS